MDNLAHDIPPVVDEIYTDYDPRNLARMNATTTTPSCVHKVSSKSCTTVLRSVGNGYKWSWHDLVMTYMLVCYAVRRLGKDGHVF